MKKKTLTIFSLLMAMSMAFTIVGCGDDDDVTSDDTSASVSAGTSDSAGGNSAGGNSATAGDWKTAKANATKISVYVDESNIYGSYVKGSDENIVKDAIEKKFWEDTGIAINLDVTYTTHSTFSSTFGNVMGGRKWDAAVSYLGQAGLEETVLNQGIGTDISRLLEQYGSHITEAVDEEAFYATTTLDDSVIGIPSVNNTKMKGILIRKDYMERVGYTDSKEEAASSNGALKYCQSIKDFDTMLRLMKSQNVCETPLIGNCYDIEFTILAGACGTTGYQYRSVNYNLDGSIKEVVPGWISEGYQQMLQYEYEWVRDGIWEADNMTATDSKRLSNYVTGKSAVYCVDPSVSSLVKVARQVQKADSKAKFTILSPLDAVDESGNAIEGTGAVAEMSRTTDCMIFNDKSSNVELLIKYMDWMYSSVDNYELCAYGIKGEQWIDVGEGYYGYPAEMADRYVLAAPYSGVFAFLHNDELSYRIYDGYSAEERGWFEKVRNMKGMKNDTDGMLIYDMTSKISEEFTKAEADMYQDCATRVWAGQFNPAEKYADCAGRYRVQAANYIEWLTTQYKTYKAKRS